MKNSDPFIQRLARLQAQLQPDQVWLIATPAHITYLTNFHFLVPEEKEALLIISRTRAILIHASFCPITEVTTAVEKLTQPQGDSLRQHLLNFTQQQPSLTQWWLDENLLSIGEFKILQTIPNLIFKALDHQSIWNLRMVKDEHEQALCQQAGHIAHQAFSQLVEIIKEGMTELQVKNLLDNLMIDLGAEKSAFPTIVAFGEHSALPHHQPSHQPLVIQTPVLIDFGAMVKGYRSDMTRTFWFGDQPSEEFVKIEKIVKHAYGQAHKLLHELPASNELINQPPAAVLTARDLDREAREVINLAGFSKKFIHTTGHGVGLDIHEPPSLNWKNDTEIRPGMVITIEPGIYLNGQFGYRYENTLLVTANNALELTT